jgi:hypothetical protein
LVACALCWRYSSAACMAMRTRGGACELTMRAAAGCSVASAAGAAAAAPATATFTDSAAAAGAAGAAAAVGCAGPPSAVAARFIL